MTHHAASIIGTSAYVEANLPAPTSCPDSRSRPLVRQRAKRKTMQTAAWVRKRRDRTHAHVCVPPERRTRTEAF